MARIECDCSICGDGEFGTCESDYKCLIWWKEDGAVKNCLLEAEKETSFRCEFGLPEPSLCCNTTRCNMNTPALFEGRLLLLNNNDEPVLTKTNAYSVPVIVSCTIIILAVVATLITLFMRRSGRCRCIRDQENLIAAMENESVSSGRGNRQLVERTITRDIVLNSAIGEGRYGQVYHASYQGNEVAVKIFNTREEASCFRENKIYSNSLLHPNILGFIASDITFQSSVTQHWLITYYHPNGSLYDYLNKHRHIGIEKAMNMLVTAATGLNYLHLEMKANCPSHEGVTCRPGKPIIAHRDIKTKNILVKYDETCCISDFGLAITQEDVTDVKMADSEIRVGTKRYLAPELLDLSIERQSIEAFKMADVYSFGLVIWETIRNSQLDESTTDYHLPYGDLVENNPSFAEMEKVVSKQKIRPNIEFGECVPDSLHSSLKSLLEESWCPKSSSRVTIFRLMKKLNAIKEKFDERS